MALCSLFKLSLHLPLLSLVAAVALTACTEPVFIGGDGGGGAGSTDSAGSAGGAGSAGSAGSTGGDGGGGAGTGGQPFPYCTMSCRTNADCDDGSPAFDADNYTCDDGACRFTGCTNDAECQDTWDASYVCATLTHSALPACTKVCQTNADCDLGAPAMDADNHACEAGACDYLGCNSDAECSDTYGAAFSCVAGLPNALTPRCWQRCRTNLDCDLGRDDLDSDNFTCEDEVCIYQGCNDTAECLGIKPTYICK